MVENQGFIEIQSGCLCQDFACDVTLRDKLAQPFAKFQDILDSTALGISINTIVIASAVHDVPESRFQFARSPEHAVQDRSLGLADLG